MAKPWRCRLKLHAWEQREDVQSGERYQVCTRCDADRPSLPRGWGGARVTGG